MSLLRIPALRITGATDNRRYGYRRYGYRRYGCRHGDVHGVLPSVQFYARHQRSRMFQISEIRRPRGCGETHDEPFGNTSESAPASGRE